jgi:hypothetical protein
VPVHEFDDGELGTRHAKNHRTRCITRSGRGCESVA